MSTNNNHRRKLAPITNSVACVCVCVKQVIAFPLVKLGTVPSVETPVPYTSSGAYVSNKIGIIFFLFFSNLIARESIYPVRGRVFSSTTQGKPSNHTQKQATPASGHDD